MAGEIKLHIHYYEKETQQVIWWCVLIQTVSSVHNIWRDVNAITYFEAPKGNS